MAGRSRGGTDPKLTQTAVLDSFFIGGFECSTHCRADGRRLDIVEATGHARFCTSDYASLRKQDIRLARDGLRWHRIEAKPGTYDWSSLLPMLEAARQAGITVMWDLCHYGWPDGIDIWTDDFIERFATFAGAAAAVVRAHGVGERYYCPINEISFLAWAGGEVGYLNPFGRGRGDELKQQLVRAAIAAIDAIRRVDPHARFLHAEPLIHVIAYPNRPEQRAVAEDYRVAQWQACDMLAGRLHPELGGAPPYLDLLGLNFYPMNQWFLHGSTIPMGHHEYRPLSDLLTEAFERYRRPLLIAETGAEGSARPAWLHYVCEEVRSAMHAGVPIEGICLYPVTSYPGWDDNRCCEVGLFGAPSSSGRRSIYQPLADEMRWQTELSRKRKARVRTAVR